MSRRLSLLLGVAALAALAALAAVLGSREARPTDADPRRSTFLAGPEGARGLSDALQRLGVTVEPFRHRSARLEDLRDRVDRTLILELDPSQPLDFYEAGEVQRVVGPTVHLLAAGDGAALLIRCFGYQLEPLARPAPAKTPGAGASDRDPTVSVVLRPTESGVADSSRLADTAETRCDPLPVVQVDTVLATPDLAPVVVRLTLRTRGRVILMADGALVSNRLLRETLAGEYLLGLIVHRYPRVVVDEYHHGFQESGSLGAAAWSWLWRSPWGWALWQAAAVALVALIVAGVRLGPPIRLERGRRRSATEHVEALASALASARGHDVAVRLMIQGLRRRLSRTGLPMRTAVDEWLGRLEHSVKDPTALESIRALRGLTQGPVSGDGVLRAANAVEDVWQELRN